MKSLSSFFVFVLCSLVEMEVLHASSQHTRKKNAYMPRACVHLRDRNLVRNIVVCIGFGMTQLHIALLAPVCTRTGLRVCVHVRTTLNVLTRELCNQSAGRAGLFVNHRHPAVAAHCAAHAFVAGARNRLRLCVGRFFTALCRLYSHTPGLF